MSAHGFTTLFNVEIPVSALHRGWLHSRELTQQWDGACIAEMRNWPASGRTASTGTADAAGNVLVDHTRDTGLSPSSVQS